jgi:adenine/guanine phosphoribosyltransferase-like PRPP-binding protein
MLCRRTTGNGRGMRNDVWQELHPPGRITPGVQPDDETWAAALPDGRTILQPIRLLPGGTDRGVASLILNQAAFAVLDALAGIVAEAARPLDPDVVVAVPTLGLPIAEQVARRLGHSRMVPLSTSRKFWYDDALSGPLGSITTPDQVKRVWIDPRMLPLLRGRVMVVDDVLSSGRSISAVLWLLAGIGVAPVAVGAAMLQGEAWRQALATFRPTPAVVAAFSTPILVRTTAGWQPEPAFEARR